MAGVNEKSPGTHSDDSSSHGFTKLDYVFLLTCLELDWSPQMAHNGSSVIKACAFAPTSHTSFLAFLQIAKICQQKFLLKRPLWLIFAG